MIFIVGGASQGKCRLAGELSGMSLQEFAANRADGGTDRPEEAMKKRFLTDFHGWIRQRSDAGEETDSFVRQVLAAGPEIVTMDEVGCGIVPLEKKDREYREAAGRAGQQLAGQAERVYRVVCGIPTRLR